MENRMLRLRPLLQATWLVCSLAATPGSAQSVGQDQGGPPPAVATQPHADRFIARFQAANTTGNGRLTLAQAQAGNLPAIVRHFDTIDTQHKGYVTLQDIRAYRQQMRAARQGGGGTDN